VNSAMNLLVPQNAGKFLSSCTISCFWRRAQLHEFSYWMETNGYSRPRPLWLQACWLLHPLDRRLCRLQNWPGSCAEEETLLLSSEYNPPPPFTTHSTRSFVTILTELFRIFWFVFSAWSWKLQSEKESTFKLSSQHNNNNNTQ
jgi:hypothetical protein